MAVALWKIQVFLKKNMKEELDVLGTTIKDPNQLGLRQRKQMKRSNTPFRRRLDAKIFDFWLM